MLKQQNGNGIFLSLGLLPFTYWGPFVGYKELSEGECVPVGLKILRMSLHRDKQNQSGGI